MNDGTAGLGVDCAIDGLNVDRPTHEVATVSIRTKAKPLLKQPMIAHAFNLG